MSNTNTSARYAQVDETVYDHPKTTRVVKALRCDRMKIVGHLSALWNWSIKNRMDGDLSDLSYRDIADAARYTNADDFSEDADIKAEAFVNALIDARTHADGLGFLEKEGKGIYIHDWHQYGGRLNEKRQRGAFGSWVYRCKEEGITIPNTDSNFNEWLNDRDALKERYRSGKGGNNGNGGGKNKPTPTPPAPQPTQSEEKNIFSGSEFDGESSDISRDNDVISRDDDVISRDTPDIITSNPNITKRSEAERNKAKQNTTERSVEEQQQSKEEGVGGDSDAPPGNAPGDVVVLSQSDSVVFVQPDLGLVRRLMASELSEAAAKQFAVDRPEECERQLEFIRFVTRFKEGRGAYLRRAIEQRWGPPTGYEEARQQEANAATRRQNNQLQAAQDRITDEKKRVEETRYRELLADAQVSESRWNAIQSEARGNMPSEILTKLDAGNMLAQRSFDIQIRRIILRDAERSVPNVIDIPIPVPSPSPSDPSDIRGVIAQSLEGDSSPFAGGKKKVIATT